MVPVIEFVTFAVSWVIQADPSGFCNPPPFSLHHAARVLQHGGAV
jgi:hypothetical protein